MRGLSSPLKHSSGERPRSPVGSAESHVDIFAHSVHQHIAKAGLLLVEEFQGHLDIEEIDHEHAEVALEPQQLIARVEHHLHDGGVREEVVQTPATIVGLDRIDRVVRCARTDLFHHQRRPKNEP